MTRSALGLASVLPAAVLAVLPQLADTVASGASPEGLVLAALVLSLAGLAAVLTFVWIAGGLGRPFIWRAAWVLALTGFGAMAAPAFWWFHIREPRAVAV